MNEAYAQFVANRVPGDYSAFKFDIAELFHAVMGLSTEANEALDVLKAYLAYGTPIDFVNLDEEMGDCLWFIQFYCNQRGLTFENLIRMNVAKLEERYPNGFSYEDALNRDLKQERAALERSHEEATNG